MPNSQTNQPRRTLLLTGASRGIGHATVKRFSAAGWRVITCSRHPFPENWPREAGPEDHIQVDLASPASTNEAIAEIKRRLPNHALDALVNNAAIHYDTWESVLTADLDVVREALETNTLGAWRLAMAMAPLLRASGHGRLVNVSSGSGQMIDMRDGAPAYSLSKTALNALTLMLADALRRDRVLVNAVCPGWVATDMGGPGGRPVSDGAAGIVWAATLPDDGPTGGFFRDGRPISW